MKALIQKAREMRCECNDGLKADDDPLGPYLITVAIMRLTQRLEKCFPSGIEEEKNESK